MDCHPQIASIGESLNRKVRRKGAETYVCSCGELLLHCPFWQQVIQAVNDQGLEFGVSNWTASHKYKNAALHRILTTYHSYPAADLGRSVATSLLPLHRARIRNIDRVCVAFIGAILDLTGAKVFFDSSKNVMHLYYLLRIPRLDIKVLRITRDVRAFVDSYKRRGRSVAEGASAWKRYQLNSDHVMRRLPSEKVCLMRYEDLFADPANSLKSIYKFLEVEVMEPATTITPRDHHVIGNRIRLKESLIVRLDEGWKTRLTEQDIGTAYRIAGDINTRFGYLR